jgi:hypothetical protein
VVGDAVAITIDVELTQNVQPAAAASGTTAAK